MILSTAHVRNCKFPVFIYFYFTLFFWQNIKALLTWGNSFCTQYKDISLHQGKNIGWYPTQKFLLSKHAGRVEIADPPYWELFQIKCHQWPLLYLSGLLRIACSCRHGRELGELCCFSLRCRESRVTAVVQYNFGWIYLPLVKSSGAAVSQQSQQRVPQRWQWCRQLEVWWRKEVWSWIWSTRLPTLP